MLELDNAAANADGDRLGSVASAEFFHDVFDMYFDCLFCDTKLISNIAVSIPAGDLAKYLHLAISKSFITDVLGNLSCNFGRDTLLAGMHLTDYFQQFLRRHAFQHV